LDCLDDRAKAFVQHFFAEVIVARFISFLKGNMISVAVADAEGQFLFTNSYLQLKIVRQGSNFDKPMAAANCLSAKFEFTSFF